MIINIIAFIMSIFGTIAVWKEGTVNKYHIIIKYIVVPVVAFFIWKYIIIGIVAPFKFIISLF